MPKERVTYLILGWNNFLERDSAELLSGPIVGAGYYGLEHDYPKQEMGADFAARIPEIDQARDLRSADDQSKLDGGVLYGGSVTSAATKPALRGWSHNISFSSVDNNTVDWGEGTITLSDATAYSIVGGTTGNIAAITYIYLDTAVSATVLQTTTTASTSVGDNKILIAVAENVADVAKFAKYQVFGGQGLGGTYVGVDNLGANIVTANEILANTITANEVAANTLTGAQILTMDLTTKTLTADTGSVGGWALSATTLANSTHIVLDASNKKLYINSGTFGADGIQLDYNAGNPRFYVGDGANAYLQFDGTKIQWKGANTELDASGNLIASSATLSGAVTATSGAIGGWTLGANALTAGSGATTVGLDTTVTAGDDIRIYAGSSTPASAPFKVMESGDLVATSAIITGSVTATSGTIGGWAVGVAALTAGSGATIVGLDNTVTEGDDIRIYAGNATPASAPFRVTESGALTATSATITGAVTATSGAIGGWSINGTSIYTGTEDHSGYTANAGDITIYSDGTDSSIHAKNFYIDTSGNLTATGVTLTGAITATSGSFTGTVSTSNITATGGTVGGWTLGANALTTGGAGTTVGLDNTITEGDDVRIYAGSATPASAPFRVTEAGVLTASNATITGAVTATSGSFTGTVSTSNITATGGTVGGWTLGANALTTGSAATTVGLDNTVTEGDDIRIYAGNATPASAPFRVTEAGALTATSATITGAITATSGAVGGWSINSTSIYTGTEDHAGYTTNAGDLTIYSDGTDASIHAKNFYIDTAGNLTCTGATVTGTVTATAGAIGGWDLGANVIEKTGVMGLDSSTGLFWCLNSTFGSDGIQVQYNAGNPRIYIGNGSTNYMSFDGTNLSVGGAVTTSNITATGGSIGGWDISSTVFEKSGVMGMDSSSGLFWCTNTAFGNSGIQIDYNAGAPRFYVGNGSTDYFQYSGGIVTLRGTLNADDITTGSLTSRTVQTHATNTGIKILPSAYGEDGDSYMEFWANTDGDAVYMYAHKTSADLQLETIGLHLSGGSLNWVGGIGWETNQSDNFCASNKRPWDTYTHNLYYSGTLFASHTAEDIPLDYEDREDGDVVVLDDNGKLVKCFQENDRNVFGVVERKSEFRVGATKKELEDLQEKKNLQVRGKIKKARHQERFSKFKEINVEKGYYIRKAESEQHIEGRPVIMGVFTLKVTGKVKKGDWLVTSNVAGHAMVNNDAPRGCVIATAMESKTSTGSGTLEAMIRKF